MRSETTVCRPLRVHHCHFVHSLISGTLKERVVPNRASWIGLVRSGCADRLERHHGWRRCSGCDAGHLGTRRVSHADALPDERHSRRVYRAREDLPGSQRSGHPPVGDDRRSAFDARGERKRAVYRRDSHGCQSVGQARDRDDERLVADETFRIFEYDLETTPSLELVLQRVHPDDRAFVQQLDDRATKDGANACLRFLAGGTPNLEEVRDGLHAIARDGRRAADVIARIRALARRTTSEKAPLDINEVVREVAALTKGPARRSISRCDLRREHSRAVEVWHETRKTLIGARR